METAEGLFQGGDFECDQGTGLPWKGLGALVEQKGSLAFGKACGWGGDR
jgi:hypothetical protein